MAESEFLDHYRAFWRKAFFTFKFCVVTGLLVGLPVVSFGHAGLGERITALVYVAALTVYISFIPTFFGFWILSRYTEVPKSRFYFTAAVVALGVGGGIALWSIRLEDELTWTSLALSFLNPTVVACMTCFVIHARTLKDKFH